MLMNSVVEKLLNLCSVGNPDLEGPSQLLNCSFLLGLCYINEASGLAVEVV